MRTSWFLVIALALSALAPPAGAAGCAWTGADLSAEGGLERVEVACRAIAEGTGTPRERADALLELADALASFGRERESLELVEKAIVLSPDIGLAYAMRAHYTLCCTGLEERRLTPASTADLDRAVALAAKDARTLKIRGDAFAAAGENAKAIASYGDAVALDPSDGEVYYDRGFLRLLDAVSIGWSDPARIAAYAEAVRDFDAAYARRETSRRTIWLSSGLYYEGRAEALLQARPFLWTYDVPAGSAAALAAWIADGKLPGPSDRGQIEAAIADLTQVVGHQPARVLDERGFAHLLIGAYAKARDDLDGYAQLTGGMPYAIELLLRAMAHEGLGDKAAAAADYSKAAIELEDPARPQVLREAVATALKRVGTAP